MRDAQLLGRQYKEPGQIACIAEARLAAAMSRGGAKKTYPHKEANEDAVCFAHGRAGALLAVADGHAGAEGAEFAVSLLLERAAPAWTDADVSREAWPELATAIVSEIHTGIVALGARHASESRTTLSLALVQPRAGFCGWAAAGDSHVFAVAGDVEELGPDTDTTVFLGSARRELSDLAIRTGTLDLTDVRAVVLATDGLSEAGIGVERPSEAVAQAVAEAQSAPPARRPIEAARGLAALAVEAQRAHRAGDNIATAVYWLAPA